MSKVLLLCMEVLGQSMAGPAIRYWEFAHALAKKHTVTLMSPNPTDLKADNIELKTHHHKVPYEELRKHDVVITQNINFKLAFAAKRHGVKLILDAYDPEPLEHLEIFKDHPMDSRVRDIQNMTTSCSFAMAMADAVICANPQQKDLWTGMLMKEGRITPYLYDEDSNLKQLIDTVPFGIPSKPPEPSGKGLRERFGIKATDHVLLWGGGVWNWFDPLSLIRAVHKISDRRSDVHLVFMGLKHPNPIIPEMRMATDAIQLAKDLKLLNTHVHVNYGWLPYHERQNYLLEATLGVSCHFDNLETRFAFRTRILDYIWASLPIVTTEGDFFAELVKARELGAVVPYQNPEALAKAIEVLIDNPDRLQKMRENLKAIQPEFYWENTTKPIMHMIDRFHKLSKSRLTFRDICKIGGVVRRKALLRLGIYCK